MKILEPATYREKYAAEAGAIIQSPGNAIPGWDAILQNDEELLWQGWSRPTLRRKKGWLINLGIGAFLAVFATILLSAAQWGPRLAGLLIVALAVVIAVPGAVWDHLRQKRVFYSLSNRRAFRASTSLLGKRRMMSWSITAQTSFRLIRDNPPSVRFYEGRLEGGRRPRYHAAFEAIPDAQEVYKLLLRIQKDVA